MYGMAEDFIPSLRKEYRVVKLRTKYPDFYTRHVRLGFEKGVGIFLFFVSEF